MKAHEIHFESGLRRNHGGPQIRPQVLNMDPAFIDSRHEICNAFLRAYQSHNNVPLDGIARATAESTVDASRFRPQHRPALLRSAEEIGQGKWPFDRYG